MTPYTDSSTARPSAYRCAFGRTAVLGAILGVLSAQGGSQNATTILEGSALVLRDARGNVRVRLVACDEASDETSLVLSHPKHQAGVYLAVRAAGDVGVAVHDAEGVSRVAVSVNTERNPMLIVRDRGGAIRGGVAVNGKEPLVFVSHSETRTGVELRISEHQLPTIRVRDRGGRLRGALAVGEDDEVFCFLYGMDGRKARLGIDARQRTELGLYNEGKSCAGVVAGEQSWGSFLLVDALGQSQVLLHAGKNDLSEPALCERDGSERFVAQVEEDTPSFGVWDPEGKPRLRFGYDRGEIGLEVVGPGGETVWRAPPR